MRHTTTLKFVADDYGETAASNLAIERLLQKSRVRHVTALGLPDLRVPNELTARRDLVWGAHLYLTDFPFLTKKLSGSFSRGRCSKTEFVKALLVRKIALGDILAEFESQYRNLVENGIRVEFLDTHQHIHGLPFLFSPLLNFAKRHSLENEIRPIAQLDFGLTMGPRILLSRMYAQAAGYQDDCRVLINCPGYKESTISQDEALMLWDKFLAGVRGHEYREIVVPCHPATSLAETEMYSSPDFFALLSRHAISVK